MPFDDAETNIKNEIDNWQKFGDAFRQENRELFKKMMLEAMADNKAFDAASSKDPTEALLMVLIFQQQKMITRLIDTLKEKRQDLSRFLDLFLRVFVKVRRAKSLA